MANPVLTASARDIDDHDDLPIDFLSWPDEDGLQPQNVRTGFGEVKVSYKF
jgi:hypothetical protein